MCKEYRVMARICWKGEESCWAYQRGGIFGWTNNVLKSWLDMQIQESEVLAVVMLRDKILV
jgi:hypothetical protein